MKNVPTWYQIVGVVLHFFEEKCIKMPLYENLSIDQCKERKSCFCTL